MHASLKWCQCFASLAMTAGLVCIPAAPSMSVRTCSPDSEYLVSRAADCLELKDVGCAKLKIEAVLGREPRCAEALFVRSWILENYDQKREAAQALREEALKLNPELSKFWERRGRAIESRLASQEFSNFDLQYYGAEDRDKAWRAVKYLNEMYGELGSAFGLYPAQRIPVIIFTTVAYIDAWRMPYTGGFFDKRDGKVRVRFDEMPGGEAEFRRRCRHELAHAFIYQLYPHDLPTWAAEGIAEYYSRSNPAGGLWKDQRLEEVRKTCRGSQWLTLEQIQNVLVKKQVSVYTVLQAYQESEALALFIAKDRGDSWVPNVIRYLREHGTPFDAAFEAVLSTTPETMMERLRHSWE